MKYEYNLLTQRLLAKGYTAENHPDYVTVNRYYGQAEPLDNPDGGFVFKRRWVNERTFRTPCGLLCKGGKCSGGMSYKGVNWEFENDMATIDCPYDKADCKEKHEYLQDDGVLRFRCNVHMVEDEYRYEGSDEQVRKLHDDEIRRKRVSFEMERNGHTCINHMSFDRDKQEWKMDYDPRICANMKCRGQYQQNFIENPEFQCPILGRPLDRKKGNVYYDLKLTYRRYDLDGTLFEGQVDTEIIKGNRMFDSPVSMDICRSYVKLCKDWVIWKVNMEYHHELFFAEYHGREFKVEVLNIRAESKESRDLMQDLQDIKDGIHVYHASDSIRKAKQNKANRAKERKEKRIQKLEKKILETGYSNLEEYSSDKLHADKWLTEERIEELEEIRQQKIREDLEKPVQLSLFEFMEK